MMLAASLALPVSLPSGHCRSYLPHTGPAACRGSVEWAWPGWHPLLSPQLPVLLLVAKQGWHSGQGQRLPRGNLPGSEARLGQPLAWPLSQYNHGRQPRPPPSLTELALSPSQSGRDAKLLRRLHLHIQTIIWDLTLILVWRLSDHEYHMSMTLRRIVFPTPFPASLLSCDAPLLYLAILEPGSGNPRLAGLAAWQSSGKQHPGCWQSWQSWQS